MTPGVYLLHFSAPLFRARHYLGYADDIPTRVGLHIRGQGSCLTRAAHSAGIRMTLAREWHGADRTFERKLKRQKNAPRNHCPICRSQRP